MLHLQDAPPTNPSRQTQPVAQDTLQNNSEGGACKTLGLVAVGHRLGVLLGNDCGGACSLAATKKQRQQKHNITNEVVLGRQSRRFTVVSNCRRFGDMLAAFPSLWACDKKSPDELLEDIRKQIQAFGNAHGWARMGPNGEYLRPHVVRKLWFLPNSAPGIQHRAQPFQRAHPHRQTPSIGVSLFHGRELAHGEVIKRADVALYQAKANGRNGAVNARSPDSN